jgi:hypothetical protein
MICHTFTLMFLSRPRSGHSRAWNSQTRVALREANHAPTVKKAMDASSAWVSRRKVPAKSVMRTSSRYRDAIWDCAPGVWGVG